MNNLKVGLLRRHRKWLYDPIDLMPPSAKKAYPDRGGEDVASEVPLSSSTRPDETSPSVVAATQPKAAASGATATVQAAAQLDTTAASDAPAVVETRGSKGVPDASIDEKAPDEKSSPAAVVPLS